MISIYGICFLHLFFVMYWKQKIYEDVRIEKIK